MVDEQKDQVKLFRSSLLAGVKAQEDRLARSKRTPTPPDHLQVSLNMASDPDMHDPIVTESKDSVIGVQENDKLSLPETLKPITSFQEESEESLDCLIKELEAEDGSEPDVDAVTIRAGEVNPYPPSLLDTNPNEGLDDAEVAARRKKYGWNRMKEQKRNHFIKFLSFFNGPVQWVMEVSKTIHLSLSCGWGKKYMLTIFSQFQIAIILAGGLRDWIDFGIICALLLLNAVVGFAQEYQAGNIVDSLKKTLALRALAVRNSCIVEINAEEVVVGDIIHVEDVS